MTTTPFHASHVVEQKEIYISRPVTIRDDDMNVSVPLVGSGGLSHGGYLQSYDTPQGSSDSALR